MTICSSIGVHWLLRSLLRFILIIVLASSRDAVALPPFPRLLGYLLYQRVSIVSFLVLLHLRPDVCMHYSYHYHTSPSQLSRYAIHPPFLPGCRFSGPRKKSVQSSYDLCHLPSIFINMIVPLNCV
ncbi:hypothetical protein BDV18DRAFT_81840 [Aspergillus unguis]